MVQALENLTRDQLQKHNYSIYAGSVHNGTTIAGSVQNGPSMYPSSVYNHGSMYNQPGMRQGFMHPSMYAGSMVSNGVYQVCAASC